jgi:transcriptional regulator with XRE-family HTH domain
MDGRRGSTASAAVRLRLFGVRGMGVHTGPVPRRRDPLPLLPPLKAKPKRPATLTASEWQAVLVCGDRALFAYRVWTDRLARHMDQAAFGVEYGVSQQTISEWERGERAHVTTEMLHLGAILTDSTVEKLLARPDTIYTDEGQVFWMAVAAAIAARKGSETTPTITEIVRSVRERATAREAGQN